MKFPLNKWLFLLLFTVILNSTITIATNNQEKFVPIFCYHRVNPTIKSIYDLTPAMLESQFQYFKINGYHPITALQYIQFQNKPELFPDKPIVLTFDDGSKDHYNYVFPLLLKYNYKATFFVYPKQIAKKSARLITWDELSKMVQAGMDIESHTFSHSFLTRTKLRPDNPKYLQLITHEIKDSKKIIEENLRIKVLLLAYPYGWYNCVLETCAVQANYLGVFTVNWGVNRLDENPLRIKRRAVSNRFDFKEMKSYLTSKPLPLQIISPRNGSIISQKPQIKFKVLNKNINRIDIIVGKYKKTITPSYDGTYFLDPYKELKSGFHLIIVSAYDKYNQLYINSWGFDYHQPN